jgi:hypothetical protein
VTPASSAAASKCWSRSPSCCRASPLSPQPSVAPSPQIRAAPPPPPNGDDQRLLQKLPPREVPASVAPAGTPWTPQAVAGPGRSRRRWLLLGPAARW